MSWYADNFRSPRDDNGSCSVGCIWKNWQRYFSAQSHKQDCIRSIPRRCWPQVINHKDLKKKKRKKDKIPLAGSITVCALFFYNHLNNLFDALEPSVTTNRPCLWCMLPQRMEHNTFDCVSAKITFGLARPTVVWVSSPPGDHNCSRWRWIHWIDRLTSVAWKCGAVITSGLWDATIWSAKNGQNLHLKHISFDSSLQVKLCPTPLGHEGPCGCNERPLSL